MIPIPSILFNQITFPLQLLASQVSAIVLPVLGVPILREGNVINLPAMALEVADACSGIRSLMSLVTLAIIYGYLLEKRLWVRWVLALASVPIAVAANSVRIIGTGLLVQYWDPDDGRGIFSRFLGMAHLRHLPADAVRPPWLDSAWSFPPKDERKLKSSPARFIFAALLIVDRRDLPARPRARRSLPSSSRSSHSPRN